MNKPKYEPAVLPRSRLPTGLPRTHSEAAYSSVGKRASPSRAMPASHLPVTMCQVVSGLARSQSSVPARRSSASMRIARAGTKNKNTHGDSIKSPSSWAYPLSSR